MGSDFIIASDEVTKFDSIQHISEYLASKYGQEVNFIVYNTGTNQLRRVSMVPNGEWGGRGLLGCQLLNGILNRIPQKYSSGAGDQ